MFRSSQFKLTSSLACCGYAFAMTLVSSAAHAEELAAAPAQPQAEPTSDVSSAAVGGDILVTARKAKERLRDVPIAITAMGGDQLRKMGHTRVDELSQFVPGANFIVANGRQASYTLRGLGGNPGNEGLEGSTGVFLDGIYLSRPGMAAMDLIDIDQVEVLRGPQGTLFGKNTTSGAVSIKTALPSFTPVVRGEATYGNYNYQQYQASVTGPIASTLAARLTGYRTSRDGIAENVTKDSKSEDINRWGLRGQLLFEPSSDLSVRLIGEYAHEQQGAGAAVMVTSQGSNYTALQKKLTATGANIAIDPDGLTTATNGPEQVGTRQYAASAEVNWKLGGFTLTSLSAFRRWTYSSNSDADLTSADAFTGGNDVRVKQWSEEVRLAFPTGGPIDAVLGTFYYGQRLSANSKVGYGSDAAAWLTGISNADLPAAAASSSTIATYLNYNNTQWSTRANPATDSVAGFGQATWHVNPQWNITGGLRVTYEAKHENVWRLQPVSSVTGEPVAALASSAVVPVHASTSNTGVSFLASTDYHVTQDIMAYGLVSRGQKAGGLNTTLPVSSLGMTSLIVKPETATNYEMGLKADLFARKLNLNLGIYRMDVQNYQATYNATLSNGSTAQFLTNIGRVRTQGVEADATLHPVQGLQLHAFAGYTDARYRSYTNAPCALENTGQTVCDLSGQTVAGAPKWTLGFSGNYEHDIGEKLAAYAGGEYSWRSHFYGSLDNSRYAVTGDYSLVNLRVGVKAKDGRWDLSVWGKNVLDKHYVTNYLNYNSFLPGVYGAMFGDPATYGVALRGAF